MQTSTGVSAAHSLRCPSLSPGTSWEVTLVSEVNADNYNSLGDVSKRSVAPPGLPVWAPVCLLVKLSCFLYTVTAFKNYL